MAVGAEVWDVVILLALVSLTMMWGLFWSMRSRSNSQDTKDYFLTGKSMPWFMVGASLFASNIGTEHFVGMAGTACYLGLAVALHEWLAIYFIIRVEA